MGLVTMGLVLLILIMQIKDEISTDWVLFRLLMKDHRRFSIRVPKKYWTIWAIMSPV